MPFSKKVVSPALAAISVFALAVASAEEATKGAPTTYALSVGDVMTIVQLRHAKVWYAAKLENWPLAAYELDKLEESLRQVVSIRPDLSSGSGAEEMLSIDPVANAITAMDPSSFDAAFSGLTDACNACHAAAGLEFIAIRAPTRFSPYSNQVFEPQ